MPAGRPRKPPKPKVKIKKLVKYLKDLPADDPLKSRLSPAKMLMLQRYVDELLYIDYILLELKADILDHGEIEIYINGRQRTRRTNPALTTYSDLVKLYHHLLRAVREILQGAELELERLW